MYIYLFIFKNFLLFFPSAFFILFASSIMRKPTPKSLFVGAQKLARPSVRRRQRRTPNIPECAVYFPTVVPAYKKVLWVLGGQDTPKSMWIEYEKKKGGGA